MSLIYNTVRAYPSSYPNIPNPIVAYKYTVAPSDATAQALTADNLRSALRIDSVSLTDAEANVLILQAQSWAQNYAGFILFTSTVTTFRNNFPDLGFELRKYPIQASATITVKYLVDAVLTTVASTVYLVAERSFYSVLFLVDDQNWPTDGDAQADVVEITFMAGYGADATFLPGDIVAGITSLAVYLYENPGDCNSCAAGSKAFPSEASRLLGFRKPLKV